ncbi:MAG: formylglycine-generating enzyme family protein [Candidatus Competibacteraceae bacterium]|nr:formylglycine-generating enzyme family protein [Candidatus Competibacteraceae bacterium]
MAGLALQAVERLRQAGLEVTRYDFQRDLRRLMGEDGRWHELAQVAARHQGARLLVIGEAASLVNPMTDALYDWTQAMASYTGRGLLSTRRPPKRWRQALTAQGILVADLSSAGLFQVAAWFSPVAVEATAGPPNPLRPLPLSLQDDERWLRPVGPTADRKQELLQTLRGYLHADGLLLLGAMAAYPQLHWGLTRALDQGLFPDQGAGRREGRLLSVARLPWCRAGGLPDWLRELLLEELESGEVEHIARLYQWLMNEAEVNGRGSISLPVSLPEPGGFWRSLRRWLRARGEVADRYDPRNDRVFVQVLLGRRARLLDFRLPTALARRLGPRLNALLPRLALGALLAGGLGWSIDLVWDQWIREPLAERLLAWQLRDHDAITVHIWHTEATQNYAEALKKALEEARFQVQVEPRELAMIPPAEAKGQATTQVQPVNAVQWGDPAAGQAARSVVERLTYLTWGGAPNEVAPGGELPLTGPGLDAPPQTSQVRVLLLTPPRERTGFVFRDPVGEPAESLPQGVFRDTLQDGSRGPEMVALPAGTFIMGSPEEEPGRSPAEGPQHQVNIRPFAIGRTEVTFAEYEAFAQAMGRESPGDEGWGRGRRPVINVSWNDAVAYAQWLSDQTGERYRLPSEAEWEYAARAGTRTPFWTGACIHTDQANYDGNYDYNDCGADTGVYRQQTVEAGSLPGNPWGLYEVAGNVWEWVQDCWHDDYQGAPQDGSAWEEPGCARRVVRGGGWFNIPENLRSANRDRDAPDVASSNQGFRLARDL